MDRSSEHATVARHGCNGNGGLFLFEGKEKRAYWQSSCVMEQGQACSREGFEVLHFLLRMLIYDTTPRVSRLNGKIAFSDFV